MDEEPTDEDIEDLLAGIAPEHWMRLWAAVDAVAADEEPFTYVPARRDGTTVVDGKESEVWIMGYVYETPLSSSARGAVGRRPRHAVPLGELGWRRPLPGGRGPRRGPRG